MRTYSITRRLVLAVLLVELVSALAVTAVAWFYERHSHFRSFDILLQGRADSLLGAVQDAEDPGDNVMLDGTQIDFPGEDVYEVVDSSGRLLGRSSNWDGLGLQPLPPAGRDFLPATIHGRAYRILRIPGVRVVDPGDKGGGIRRYVTIAYGAPVKRVWRAIADTVSFYALSSLAVLAVTGLLMFWLLNRGLAPLRQLASSAAQVSAVSWTFAPPPETRRIRELSPLVSALEALLQSLELSFEQQKRFVGDAAHELKTAVAVVKSSLQLLNMKPRTTLQYQEGLQRCLTDCERMEGLVAQMLTLARIEDSPVPPDTSTHPPTDLVPILRESTHLLATVAQAASVHLEYCGPETLLACVGAEPCQLLINNLLLNAIQHSPPGEAVILQLSISSEFAEILVIDRGEGIHPQDLPRIFERFSRGDPSRSRKTGGAGLGLAICKAIVDRTHGRIAIHSQPHAGTTVAVYLPVAESCP
jgi:signal transduction histidine kinase